MTDYTIYCTSEQTRKAYELGAPIEKDCSTRLHDASRTTYMDGCSYCKYYCNPTAEQMIGWLEEQGVSVEITMASQNIGYYSLNRIDSKGAFDFTGRCEETYSSRKEATLAAIDAALDFI